MGYNFHWTESQKFDKKLCSNFGSPPFRQPKIHFFNKRKFSKVHIGFGFGGEDYVNNV